MLGYESIGESGVSAAVHRGRNFVPPQQRARGEPDSRPGVVHLTDMSLPRELLDESAVLFQDVRPEDVDAEAHAAFVIARVLDLGTVRSVRALLRHYGPDRIRAFFREGGANRVSRRTVPLWTAFFKLTADECTPRSSPRRSSPFWTA